MVVPEFALSSSQVTPISRILRNAQSVREPSKPLQFCVMHDYESVDYDRPWQHHGRHDHFSPSIKDCSFELNTKKRSCKRDVSCVWRKKEEGGG